MHPFSLSSLFLLLLLLPPPPSTATHTRRTLQQSGFFPEASSPPPANPPSAATSFSTPTLTQQPFFPSIPSPPPRPTPPPPPPPPATTNFPSSLPVNISSLNLPHAPKSNPIPSILFVTAAAVVLLAAIALFFYLRRRRLPQNSYDSKSITTRSDNTNSVDSRPNELPRRIGRSPPTSSEFLYVGTIVDSHGGVNPLLAPIKGGVRKLDSPDLSPLPPLDHRKNQANAIVASEEDVFFSSVEFLSSM